MAKPKTKKMHDADIAARADIAGAVEFTAYQHRFGGAAVIRGMTTLADASLVACGLELQHRHRRALIYAIVRGISQPVPNDMRAAAFAAATADIGGSDIISTALTHLARFAVQQSQEPQS